MKRFKFWGSSNNGIFAVKNPGPGNLYYQIHNMYACILRVVGQIKQVVITEAFKTHNQDCLKLRLTSLTHRQIRGDLISMFKINHGLLESPLESTFTNPTLKGLRDHRERCCTHRRLFTFTIRAVPFWSKLPAALVYASSEKSFKTPLVTHWQSLFPKVPI